ncbi:hypothetical protein OEZ85_009566 [Tetradesmus obliquus]|uniref:Fungal lipase-type domain-containing protein n=1 Tax=Tetradesmus obliquus TaxID=3088 RepID=A0ABY8U9P5_TETOB|nr:hypothetical protein OEZ85_009566 [Tetradesmus obliquus]
MFSGHGWSVLGARVMGSQCYGFVEFEQQQHAEEALMLVCDGDPRFAVNGGQIRASWARGSMPDWKRGKALLSKHDSSQGLEGLEAYEHPMARMLRLQAAAVAAQAMTGVIAAEMEPEEGQVPAMQGVPAAAAAAVAAVRPVGAAAGVRALVDYGDFYRLAEFLPLTPLLAVLVLLSCFPDWVLEKADQGAEWMLYVLLGFKRAELRDNTTGQPTGRSCLYSVAGALDPDFSLPDTRLLAVPRSEADREHAFPSKQAASWGNATFLALCMKVAYEDWAVVRDVVNHEWRVQGDDAASRDRTYLRPRFVKGCSFYFMQPAGTESSEELSHIHLDSDACLIAVERPCAAGDQPGAVGEGAALVLAFRGTEPLELSDFQSDFDAVPEAGDWGSLHPGFLLALGLDPNLDPYHQTLTTYTALTAEAAAAEIIAGRAATPYEVLRNQINSYMTDNPTAKLYVTGHSLGGALAVVFMGALMHDTSKQAAAAKARIGALYTFGQPRVGDYEFLCHLSVSLLEPAAGSSSSSSSADGTAAASAGGSSSSKLRGLWGGAGRQQEETAGPPLTSRYIRVVNTYDIVPHIPPTLCNLYQHGGDLLYLQMLPGQVKWLTEQPMFFISGIWSSSLVKLYHFGAVKLGLRHGWWGSDNYIRFGMRLGAVALPFLIAGLNDHMPGDYCQQVANSDPAAWQPFKSRKKLSRKDSTMAGPRPTLLLAAFALLVVLATANDSGMLRGRKFNRTFTPDPPVYSFGWAPINIHRVDFNRSCETACQRYGFAVIQSASAALCTYTSAIAKGTVYGTWTPAGAGTPPADDDTCRASFNGTQIDSASEKVTVYNCGCCGTINRRGYKLSCPTSVVEYAASASNCSSSVSWTGSAGGDGTKVCLRPTNNGAPGAPLQFGTISSGKCAIWDTASAADWQKVCMKVNKV